jgi:hypothetical protein
MEPPGEFTAKGAKKQSQRIQPRIHANVRESKKSFALFGSAEAILFP